MFFVKVDIWIIYVVFSFSLGDFFVVGVGGGYGFVGLVLYGLLLKVGWYEVGEVLFLDVRVGVLV